MALTIENPVNGYYTSQFSSLSTASPAQKTADSNSQSYIIPPKGTLNSQPDRRVSAAENTGLSKESANKENATSSEQLNNEQQIQQVLNQLKARDREVRAHEMAHLSAAGAYSTGGMSFTYQTGPDGKRYAIGGEVGIDTSPVSGDPEATLQKAQVIQRAALAPAEPSAQDRKVAALASRMMMEARAEIAQQATENEDTHSSGISSAMEDKNNTELEAKDVGQSDSNVDSNENSTNLMLQERIEFEVRRLMTN